MPPPPATIDAVLRWNYSQLAIPEGDIDLYYGAHTFNRQRNNARDHRTYHFEYIQRSWPRNPGIRQIIVRATNPNGNTVQLSDRQVPNRAYVGQRFPARHRRNDRAAIESTAGLPREDALA